MNFIGMKDLLGKTITGVVYKVSDSSPSSQLMLILSDGSWYEFYSTGGEVIMPSHSSSPGGLEGARKYGSERLKILYEAYLDGEQVVIQEY
jgi:hypothetical protein